MHTSFAKHLFDARENAYAPTDGQACVPLISKPDDQTLDVAPEGGESHILRLIDPAITWYSPETEVFEEGCLSFPDHFGEITRPSAVKARYTDENNRPCEIETDGLLARCIQHEIDHLDGVLMVDHLSALRRGIILRKLIKMRKAEAKKSA